MLTLKNANSLDAQFKASFLSLGKYSIALELQLIPSLRSFRLRKVPLNVEVMCICVFDINFSEYSSNIFCFLVSVHILEEQL